MSIIREYQQVYAPQVFLKSLNQISGDIIANMIDFEFTEDPQKMNLVTLRIADPNFIFTNDKRFQQGVGYEMRWGYLTDISTIERFVASRITFSFPDANNMPVITLQASGFEKLMNLSGNPHNYGPVASSDIATRIAERYSLKAVVEPSKDARKQNRIQSSDTTDFEFLSGLAKKLSWEFFIEENTLYFRPFSIDNYRSNNLNSESLVFSYRDDETGTLLSFEPVVNKKPGLIGTTGTNIQKGKPAQAEVNADRAVIGAASKTGQVCTWGQNISEDERLALIAQEQALRGGGSRPTQTQNKRVPLRFATPEESDTLIRSNAEALAIHLKLNTEKAQATFVGSPRLRARRIITINNVGPYSGQWLITGTTHKISAESGYTVTTTLSRATTKDATKAKTGPATPSTAEDPPVFGFASPTGAVETQGILLQNLDKR